MTRGKPGVLGSGLAVLLVCLGLWLARAEVA
jgi:hypothetical protein